MPYRDGDLSPLLEGSACRCPNAPSSSSSRTAWRAGTWARSSAGSRPRGTGLAALDLRVPSRELLAAHYADHVEKPFYPELVEFMSSGPVAAVVAEGVRVIEGVLTLLRSDRPDRGTAGDDPR